MSQGRGKRYCLERLVMYNVKNKMETWQAKMYADDIRALEAFLADRYRIIDTWTKKEVMRNVDLSRW